LADGELKYSHEPNLARRVKDVLGRCPEVSRSVVGNSKARNSFVRDVVDTRNYEAHLDRSKDDTVPQGVNLATLVYQVRALVEMTLLLELGFTCDDIHKALWSHESALRVD
jgi:hypothetical protein